MGCITGLVAKIFLTAFNAAVAITAVAVLTMCALVMSYVSNYGTDIISTNAAQVLIGLESVSGFVICLGVLGMLVSCCCSNKLFLYTYFILGGCLVVCVLTFGIIGTVNIDNYANETKTNMIEDMKKYDFDTPGADNSVMDDIYRSNECCGVNGYTDFRESNTDVSFQVPLGCCEDADAVTCNYRPIGGDKIYEKGCYDQLVEDVGELAIATFNLGIFFAVLTMALILSTCLCVKCTDAMPI